MESRGYAGVEPLSPTDRVDPGESAAGSALGTDEQVEQAARLYVPLPKPTAYTPLLPPACVAPYTAIRLWSCSWERPSAWAGGGA